jgi:hypothetical protein
MAEPGRAARAYTRTVPAERIAENLASINWTLLTSLAVGSFWAAAFGRLATAATKGYLAFIALSAAALGVLAALSDGALPPSAEPAWDAPRGLALWAVVLAAVAYAVALQRGARVRGLAIGGSVLGLGVLIAGSLSWGGGTLGAALLLVELATLSAATGGVWAAMILGHWYLVTPHLPEAPLVGVTRLLGAVVALQVALFVAWTAFGAGPSGRPGFATLGGEWALFVWLRLIVGLAMPLVITWAALQTARTRSMESATGLLYIDVGLIAAGTILAAGLYFGAGLLV